MFQKDDPAWQHLRGDELAVLAEIQQWASRPPSRLDKALALVGKPIEKAYGLVPDAIKDGVTRALEGTLGMLRDGAGFTVSEGLVLGRLELPGGAKVTRLDQVRDLDIRALDRASSGILLSHAAAVAGIGGGAGAAGLPGLAADLPALYTLLFRMVLELGFLYGFDSHHPGERQLALRVLLSGHELGQMAKVGVLSEAIRVQRLLARRASWKELEKSLLVQAIQQIARKLGVKVVKRKLAQAVIVVGALVGAGGNYALAQDVGVTAFQAYRLRFLHRRATERQARGW